MTGITNIPLNKLRAWKGSQLTERHVNDLLEVLNEPMVEDGYRWFGMQAKLISAIRSGAPRHTIIAAGHRPFSG